MCCNMRSCLSTICSRQGHGSSQFNPASGDDSGSPATRPPAGRVGVPSSHGTSLTGARGAAAAAPPPPLQG